MKTCKKGHVYSPDAGKNCPNCQYFRYLKWAKNNREKIKSYNDLYTLTNSEKARARTKNWKIANKARVNSNCAKRKAVKLQRAKLNTVSDWVEIEWAYKIAQDRSKETGQQYDVDHIIPLLGEYISGLHVPSNLQILLHDVNIKKSNRINLEELNDKP